MSAIWFEWIRLQRMYCIFISETYIVFCSACKAQDVSLILSCQLPVEPRLILHPAVACIIEPEEPKSLLPFSVYQLIVLVLYPVPWLLCKCLPLPTSPPYHLHGVSVLFVLLVAMLWVHEKVTKVKMNCVFMIAAPSFSLTLINWNVFRMHRPVQGDYLGYLLYWLVAWKDTISTITIPYLL